MAQLLIRGLDGDALARLKARAKAHGRSLESEARTILESAAGFTATEARGALARWQQALRGRKLTDSRELLAEDRRR